MKTLPALAAALALAACGQTGPLRQPEPKPAVEVIQPPADSAAEKPKPSPSP